MPGLVTRWSIVIPGEPGALHRPGGDKPHARRRPHIHHPAVRPAIEHCAEFGVVVGGVEIPDQQPVAWPCGQGAQSGEIAPPLVNTNVHRRERVDVRHLEDSRFTRAFHCEPDDRHLERRVRQDANRFHAVRRVDGAAGAVVRGVADPVRQQT
jgi:hypothetical protein